MKKIIIVLFLSYSAFGQLPVLFDEVNNKKNSSNIASFTEAGSVYFFSADDETGKALWKTDGTAVGTVRLKNFTEIESLVNVNGILYFIANDGVSGKEVWKSDGTSVGTVLLKDIALGTDGSYPSYMTNFNGTLLFSAAENPNAGNGNSLWKSDGTTAGTTLIYDQAPGSTYSVSPSEMTLSNGFVYFSGLSSSDGIELWRTDGTTAGTYQVKNINSAYTQGSNPSGFTYYNGFTYFSAFTSAEGYELWRTDGTLSGTTLVKDIWTGSASGTPRYFIEFNGNLHFSASTSQGLELWKTDGTAAGTVLVKDLNVGTGGSDVTSYYIFNNNLYFAGKTQSSGSDFYLFKSDGTDAGTVQITYGNATTAPKMNPNIPMFPFNGALYFAAIDPTNSVYWDQELWKTDGTNQNTEVITNISGESNIRLLGIINNKMLMNAKDKFDDAELWQSDGTNAGTTLLKNINDQGWSSTFSNLQTVGKYLFYRTVIGNGRVRKAGLLMPQTFEVSGGIEPNTPLISTGTNGTDFFACLRDVNYNYQFVTNNPVNVGGFNYIHSSTYVAEMKSANGFMYYSRATTAQGEELWKTDGTTNETVLVKDIKPGTASSRPQLFEELKGDIYFKAFGTNGNNLALYKSDGTSIGTILLKDFVFVEKIFRAGNLIYLSVYDTDNQWKLYKSDGTVAGTVPVVNITSSIANMIDVNGTLFYIRYNGNFKELWKSDGTSGGTMLVHATDISSTGFSNKLYTEWANLNGVLYFTGYDTTNGHELWKTDGTTAGTIHVKDIRAGSSSSGPNSLLNVNGILFFLADDGVNGSELWKSNGTAAGTQLVTDLYPGLTGSDIKDMVDMNGSLIFQGNNRTDGNELFIIKLNESALIEVQNAACTMATLSATPKGKNFSYQWKQDGVVVPNANSDTFKPVVSGYYSVAISDVATGFVSYSKESSVTVNVPNVTISTPNSVLCGSNLIASISTTFADNQFTLSWERKSFLENSTWTVIPNSTTNSISTYEAGEYKLGLLKTGCTLPEYSNIINLSYGSKATITNSSLNTYDVTLAPTGNENLRVNFAGIGPWEIGINEGASLKKYYANTNPFIIPVSPSTQTIYSLNYVTNACGTYTASKSDGEILVKPSPAVVFNFGTPTLDPYSADPTLSGCRGSLVTIPYTSTGDYGKKALFNIDFFNEHGKKIISITSTIDNLQTSGNFSFNVPVFIYSGPYTFFISAINPSYFVDYKPPYLLYVASCNSQSNLTPSVLITEDFNCEYKVLKSSVIAEVVDWQTTTYTWYKNDVAIPANNSPTLKVTEPGNYKVQLISGGYFETSQNLDITFTSNTPTVSASGTVTCGGGALTLSTPATGAGYTYQWYKERIMPDQTIAQIPIFGATNSAMVVNQPGSYFVKIWDGNCYLSSQNGQVGSSSLTLTNGPTSNLVNSADNNDPVSYNSPVTAPLKAYFTGTAPWTFDLIGSDGNIITHTATTSPYSFNVSPTVNTNYSLSNLNSTCGEGTSTGSVLVKVLPDPNFNIGTSSLLSKSNANFGTNICPGSTISVSLTKNGNWPQNANFEVELVNATTNASISGTKKSGYTSNPIKYFVPYDVAFGTYKLKLTSIIPYIETPLVTNSTYTVTNTGCAAPEASILAKSSCSSSLLKASPNGAGYTYQWFKNQQLIVGEISSDYLATEDGNYSVQIVNSSQGYSATSTEYTLVVDEISTGVIYGGSLCSASGSMNLQSNNTNNSLTYQWYFSSDKTFYTPVVGQTNNSIYATTPGFYYVLIQNGNCQKKSEIVQTCTGSVNFKARTVCQNANLKVPFSFRGGDNRNLTIQLLNATNNSVVVSNIFSTTSSSLEDYTPSIQIPSNIPVGTYKFRLISAAPSNFSSELSETLTIANLQGGSTPTIFANLNSVNSPQNVSFIALGCPGEVQWVNSDVVNKTNPSFSALVNKNVTYSVLCQDLETGCVSNPGTKTIEFLCNDQFEPNNNSANATILNSTTYESPTLCLNGNDNPDWFGIQMANHDYFIKVSMGENGVAGNYKLKLTLGAQALLIETIPEQIGQELDTYITLIDSDGLSVISENDNGNPNRFSKITFTTCANSLTLSSLNSPSDDINNGTITKQVNATIGTITATNKLTGTANVTYRAGKSISLEPGFKADNGTTFKTEFGGCN